MKKLTLLSLLLFWCLPAHATTRTAADCNSSSVQTTINASSVGDTVLIPAGTCTWSSGVTATGIIIQGAGSGRIIAIDGGSTSLTVGTGSKTLTIANYSPGFSAASIFVGQILTFYASNNSSNYMTGAVTAFNSGTGSITINAAATSGSGTFAAGWMIATQPSTIIVNNTSTQLFALTESTTVNTSLERYFLERRRRHRRFRHDDLCHGRAADSDSRQFHPGRERYL